MTSVTALEYLASAFAEAIQKTEAKFGREVTYLEMIGAANLAGQIAPELQSAYDVAFAHVPDVGHIL